MQKLLIPIQGDYVAPRFDLASEIIISRFEDGRLEGEMKTIIMERASDEELCQMVVEANITDVVCGAIEETHYNFLAWKRVNIFDSIVGGWKEAIELRLAEKLTSRQIIIDKNNVELNL